jgi:hypothetical protein
MGSYIEYKKHGLPGNPGDRVARDFECLRDAVFWEF